VFTDEYFLGCGFIFGLEKSLFKLFGSVLLCLGVAPRGKLVVVVGGG